VASAGVGPARWRGGRTLVAVQALIEMPADSPAEPRQVAVRFGVTVGKRNARRAVDRARVKRVLREAARLASAALDRAAGARRVAVVLRLRAPLPAAERGSLPALKRQLRAEADALLEQLARHLRAAPGGA
jgi:RNase P protein component